MNKISIIGCGWLGLSLAKALVDQQYQVAGSTTTSSKLDVLEKNGIRGSLLKLNPMPEGKYFQQLFENETLVINIPPGSRKHPPEYYREQIKYLKYLINNSEKVKRVIFISSTSYYPNNDQVVDESTKHDLSNGSNQAIVWAEQEISQIKPALIILRPGGLMGDDRIPGKYFAGKETEGRDNPTNYIHREDVIKTIKELLRQKEWPQVKNLVNPEHHTRQKVMMAMAKKHDFESPIWKQPFRTSTKIVDSIHPQVDLIDPLNY